MHPSARAEQLGGSPWPPELASAGASVECSSLSTQQAWEQGDALVFLSHKYHCVSRLTRGTRQVMVCELWQGTENLEPSRDEQLRWRGEWR